jgi:hypothetical protein
MSFGFIKQYLISQFILKYILKTNITFCYVYIYTTYKYTQELHFLQYKTFLQM